MTANKGGAKKSPLPKKLIINPLGHGSMAPIIAIKTDQIKNILKHTYIFLLKDCLNKNIIKK